MNTPEYSPKPCKTPLYTGHFGHIDAALPMVEESEARLVSPMERRVGRAAPSKPVPPPAANRSRRQSLAMSRPRAIERL